MLKWLRRKKSSQSDEKSVQNEADSWDVLRGIFSGDQKVAGSTVNEKTSMKVSTVYACVRLIAGAIAGLPVHIYDRDPDGERTRVDHRYWNLLNQEPAPAYSAASFWEWIVAQMLLRGDGFAYIVRNRAGEAVNLIPLHRSQVAVRRQESGNPRTPHRLVYYISTDDGAFGADQDDMLHFPGMGFDGCSSMSVIQWGARQSTGIAISADEYAGTFFSEGAQPQHVVKAAGKMTESQQQAFREAWAAKYSGKGPNGLPLILTEGLDVDQLSMSSKDAQLLESRQWQVIDIARAFGVPPFMVGEQSKSTSWGSGIEQMGIGFVTYTLSPPLRRFQSEINRKLFRRQRRFCEFDTRGLLRGDHESRANYYQAALGGTQNPAWMTQNEVRKLENLPSKAGGDELNKPESSDEPNEPAPTDQG